MKKFAIGSTIAAAALALVACTDHNNTTVAPANDTTITNETEVDTGNALTGETVNETETVANDAEAVDGNAGALDNAAVTNAVE